jgi:hypothetical protein
MAPRDGSDSERMMAQIEAFLRTGEAPPAAPEPPPASPLPPNRAFEPDSVDLGAGGSAAPWRIPRGRLSERLSVRLPVLRTWSRPAGRGRRRGSSPGRLPPGPPRWTPLRVVLVLGLLVGLLVLPVVWSDRSGQSSPDGPDRASAAPAGPGYAFLRVNRTGTPVRWNPCTPIYYQLDLASAPVWANADLAEALADVSAATGIEFVDDGPTDQFPSDDATAGPGSYESPVVLAWASPAESRAEGLAGSVGSGVDSLGLATPVAAVDEATGHSVYVGGRVVIAAAASALPAGFGPGGGGILLLHLLGRLMGLADVDNPGQVMGGQALAGAVTGFGAGDRAGLARLGARSGCLQIPAGGSLEPVL